MKLEELRKEIINSYMKRWMFPKNGTWSFNLDGNVDVSESIEISREIYRLPFKFGTIDGDFRIRVSHLNSLYGLPKSVKGHIMLDYLNSCVYNRETIMKVINQNQRLANSSMSFAISE